MSYVSCGRRPVSTVKTRTLGLMRQAISRMAMPSIWKLVQMATRAASKVSNAQPITSCGSWSSYSTPSSPISHSSKVMMSFSATMAVYSSFCGVALPDLARHRGAIPIRQLQAPVPARSRRPSGRVLCRSIPRRSCAGRRTGTTRPRRAPPGRPRPGAPRRPAPARPVCGGAAAGQWPRSRRGRHLAAVGLTAPRGSLQADSRDPMGGAGMRAAVHAELEAADLLPEALLQAQRDLLQFGLGARHGEVTERLAGAGHAGAAQAEVVEREADLGHPRDHLVQPRLGYTGQDEVLLAGQANVAPVRLREVGDLHGLFAGDLADEDREAHVVQALLLLPVDAQVIGMAERLRRLHNVFQPAPQPLLHGAAHAVHAIVVDQELQARLGPREAVLGVFTPDVQDGPGGGQHVIRLDEDAQVARNARGRREAAADAHAESQPLAVGSRLPRADEGDAVDLRRVALVGAGGDGDLVLARQVEVLDMGQEIRHYLV